MSRDDIIQRRRSRHFVSKTNFFREIKFLFRFFRENAEVFLGSLFILKTRVVAQKSCETKSSLSQIWQNSGKILSKFTKKLYFESEKLRKWQFFIFYLYFCTKCSKFKIQWWKFNELPYFCSKTSILNNCFVNHATSTSEQEIAENSS